MFQITVKFKGEFVGSGTDDQRNLCSNLAAAARSPFNVTTSPLQCPGGSTGVTLKSATKTSSGNKCSDNMELIDTVSGNQQCGKI